MNNLGDSELLPFSLTWNIRNITHLKFNTEQDDFGIINSSIGEYPIDSYGNIPLEIPADARRSDVSGRSNYKTIEELEYKEPNNSRVIKLPCYSRGNILDLRQLRLLIRHWSEILLGDNIPCIALATKCRGFYADQREAQVINVLAVWSDSTARILTLEWFEGPLDDCITPEWHFRATPVMNLPNALGRACDPSSNINWEGLCFALYTIPACLGQGFQVTPRKSPYPSWGNEWLYDNNLLFKKDLETALGTVRGLFSVRKSEVK